MKESNGFALMTVLIFMSVVLTLIAAYSLVSRTEMQSLHSSKNSFAGFNVAEAGLNLRADIIKNDFENYNRPSGTSPVNEDACANAGTAGTGDFACQSYTLGTKHSAVTYVSEDQNGPSTIIIPKGEPFAGLTATEYHYTVQSVGQNPQKNKEAMLELMFNTRLIPLFQFLLFFDGDMELVEGGEIKLSGPIHSNKDIYFAQQAAYWIPDPYSYFKGPVSSAGTMYRGAKFQTSCFGGSGGWNGGWNYDILIHDLSIYKKLPTCSGNRFAMTNAQLAPFNGNVAQKVPALTVPDVRTFKAFSLPDPAHPNTFTYWARSDVRFVLRLNSATGMPVTTHAATGIEVVDTDGHVMQTATNRLNDATVCPGNFKTGGGAGRSVGAKGNWGGAYASDGRLRLFRDYQHHTAIYNYETTIDVDLQNLFNCMHKYHGDFFSSGDIDDSSDGGLVLYFAIDGPLAAATQNNYAVRFSHGALLQASTAGSPLIKGLTLVTDQKAVLWGDYNANDATWIPSAILSDSQYILSNKWVDAWSNTGQDWWNRFTNTTTLKQQVAILSGDMPSCGGDGVTCEGSFNDFGGGYTGMFRFNETFYDGNAWSTSFTQQPMVWKGSLVSLHAPYHNDTLEGPFNYFSSPSYEYAYDTRFNDPSKLPPLTPRAVYNKQELFERNYQ